MGFSLEDSGKIQKIHNKSYPTIYDEKEKASRERDFKEKVDFDQSFAAGEWNQGVTAEPVTLYRMHGDGGENGGYWTTKKPTDKMDARMETALPYTDFKNNRVMGNAGQSISTIEIPAGTPVRYGNVAPQETASGYVLPGGGEQIYIEDPRQYSKTTEPLSYNSGFSEFEKKAQQIDTSVDQGQREPTQHLPSSNTGTFDGERGNSTFYPNNEAAQSRIEEYGQSGVEYHNGNPDFSPFAQHNHPEWGSFSGQVEIGHMTPNRTNPSLEYGRRAPGEKYDPAQYMGNYEQADAALAERLGVAPQDIAAYRGNNDNPLTWHECADGKTMQLIPSDIHNACRHSGGVSQQKEIAGIAYGDGTLLPESEALMDEYQSEAPAKGESEEPAESEGEAPAKGESEEPAEGEGEEPAEGEGEEPAEGEGEEPIEGEGEEPIEGEGEAPAEGEGEEPAEGEGEAPAEGEGEAPAEGEGEEPAEGEDEEPAEGESEAPTEGEGEEPAEGEGEAPA